MFSTSVLFSILSSSRFLDIFERIILKYVVFLIERQFCTSLYSIHFISAELELKMEQKYEFLIAKQNATEIHALANEARGQYS